MNPFENISAENLHHAYLVVGEKEATRKSVGNFLTEKCDLIISGNPDVQNIFCDTLTIDFARKIAQDASRKSFAGKRKFFLIETNIVTEEAQNALLKIFEEPTDKTHFFILMPQDTLLTTLRSRVQVIKSENQKTKNSENILAKPIAEKLGIVKKMTEEILDEEKTKQDAVDLVNQIESELYQNGMEKEADNLALCQKTRESLHDRGAPIKMILENLMISLG